MTLFYRSCGALWHYQGMTLANNSPQLKDAVRDAIKAIAVGPDRGRDISAELAEKVMNGILDGAVDPVQAAVFLIALRMKREASSEFAGLLAALDNSTSKTLVDVETLICLADPFDGYVRNATMTPFIAPVLAACGLSVLMHGVETVGPKHGVTAHKVYQAFGINTLAVESTAKQNIEKHGWAYLDQSIYNAKLFALQDLRDKMIKRSALTTLERLLCPLQATGTTALALAYVHKAYPNIYAEMAKLAGYQKVLLFKGVEGGLAPALNKPLRRYFCDSPESFEFLEKQVLELDSDLQRSVAAAPLEDTEKAVQETLKLGLKVLAGSSDIARQSLVLSSAHILFSFGVGVSFASCVEKVERSLDNGSALAAFRALS